MSIRVFISHRGIDKPWAETLARELRKHGVDAWLDKWEIKPGESIVQKIQDGLETSEFLLLVLTPESVDPSAKWVATEWESFLSARLSGAEGRLIPILLRETPLPAILRHLKYINFTDDTSFDERFAELYQALHGITERPPLELHNVDIASRVRFLQRLLDEALALRSWDVVAKMGEDLLTLLPHDKGVISKTSEAYRHQAISLKDSDPARAHRLFGKAIKLTPERVDLFRLQGETYINQGRFLEAVESLNHALVLNPNDAESFFARAFARMMLKEFDVALSDVDRAIEIQQSSAYHFLRRDVLQALGRNEDAVDAHRRGAYYYLSTESL